MICHVCNSWSLLLPKETPTEQLRLSKGQRERSRELAELAGWASGVGTLLATCLGQRESEGYLQYTVIGCLVSFCRNCGEFSTAMAANGPFQFTPGP